MNLIDSREREKLLQWAAENEDKAVFMQGFDDKRDSYYIDREDRENIWQYAPESVNDFIGQCQNVWDRVQENELLRILAIAILKAEPETQKKHGKSTESDMQYSDKIPEYIYVF